MADAEWVPLSRRNQGLGPEPPVEGVPYYLERPLQDWLERRLWQLDRLHLELRLRVRSSTSLWRLTGDRLLDAIDAYLYWSPFSEEVGNLARMLEAGGSVWRVNKRLDGLERRVDETVTAAFETAKQSASEEASDHLTEAWRAAYGRDPDPDKAYDEAVLAVEAVACPLVAPDSDRATLGTVIRDLRNQVEKWELAIGDRNGQPASIDRLIDMMALLWEGQSRHAGAPNSRRQTQVEGEAAVHLAATLVQWLTSGVLRRKQ